MKTATMLALATAAAATPLRGHRHVATGTATPPQSTGTAQSSSFALRSFSTDAKLTGRYASELHSTDDGQTAVILGPKNSTAANPLKMDGMFLIQGSLAVVLPARSGGSEYDYLSVGAADNATGLAAPAVIPAGFGNGWYLKNSTRSVKTRRGNDLAVPMTLLGYTNADGKDATMLSCDNAVQNGTATDNVQQLILAYDVAATRNATKCSPIQMEVVYDSMATPVPSPGTSVPLPTGTGVSPSSIPILP